MTPYKVHFTSYLNTVSYTENHQLRSTNNPAEAPGLRQPSLNGRSWEDRKRPDLPYVQQPCAGMARFHGLTLH